MGKSKIIDDINSCSDFYEYISLCDKHNIQLVIKPIGCEYSNNIDVDVLLDKTIEGIRFTFEGIDTSEHYYNKDNSIYK